MCTDTEKKFVPSLQICFPITLSPTHRSPLLSAREILGRHRRERIFILTLLIRKELNLSGNSHSFFFFRHTVKSILRSDCKSCKISLSFKAVFAYIIIKDKRGRRIPAVGVLAAAGRNGTFSCETVSYN